MEPIKREGTVIATLPPGANICRITWRGFPAFLIASPDRPPYVLQTDGTTHALQCKDIPDDPILEFIGSHNGAWCNWYFGDEKDVHAAVPAWVPDRLLVAKMARLIERGLVDGCPCGCRGDYVLTEKGKQALVDMQSAAAHHARATGAPDQRPR